MWKCLKEEKNRRKSKTGGVQKIRKTLIAALLAVGMLAGCGKSEESENKRFKQLEGGAFNNFYIAYDMETGVEYAVSNGLYNKGNLTVLIDAEGKPLIYEGGKK